MLDKVPNAEEMTTLVGQSLYDVWNKLCALIDEKYEMERLWIKGGKAWTYEYKYRRGGKTLCALYAREKCIGFMIIFGKDERARFEAERNDYSQQVQKIYDEAQTYRDGKWVMFEPTDTSMFQDFIKLLSILSNYISLFSYLFISYQMSAKPYFIGSTGIFTFCSRSHIGAYLLMFSLSNVVNFVVNTSMLSDALSLFWHSQ